MARFNIPKKEGFLCVGVITQPHSLHGEVLVKTFLDDETLLAKGVIVETADNKEMVIEKARSSNKGLLVKFEGIKNRNDAEKARKTYLYLSHEDFPQEDEDEIYYFELKEFNLVDSEKKLLGSVTDAFDNGANTVLEIKLANPVVKEDKEVKKILIPFTQDMILEVNKQDLELVADLELFEMYLNL